MNSTTETPIDRVLGRLDQVSGQNGQYEARCPAHSDNSPSLSVSEGSDGRVLLKCHAGCDYTDVVAAMGLEPQDLFPEDADDSWAPWDGTEVARYTYVDAEGDPAYEVVRYEMRDPTHPAYGDKTFRPYLPGKQRPGLGKQDRLLYRLPTVLEAARSGKVVFVVEGEKDVHTLEDAGLVATTAGSSDSWKDRFAERLEGARVVVIPDNDDPGRELAEDVARSCHGPARWVRVLHLDDVPDGGGDVTDWLERGHTADELKRAVEAAPNWTPAADGAPRGDGQAGKPEAPDSWSAIQATYDSDKRQARVDAARQAIRDRRFATHAKSGRLYVYDDEACVYDEQGEQALSTLLVRKLGKHHSRHEQKEIAAKIKAQTRRESFGGPFIPVANGDLFLDGDGPRLEDPDPDRAPLARSPAAWDPDAEPTRFIRHLAARVGSTAERETLQEYAGYCLMHWQLPYHKALFVVGPTASGKSTTLSVLQKLLGSVASLSPQQLVNGRFGPAELEGAWANVRSDISAALLKDIGLFKELVAGDPIHAERKHEQGYMIHPTAKHIYSANQLPDVAIDDDAFYRRILLVSFPDTIPRDERVDRADLDATLEAELDGILRWAVQGLRRLLENEGFTHDHGPEATRRQWEARGGSIGRFKAAALDVTGDSDDVVPKGELYRAYTAFCEKRGLASESQTELTRSLKRDPAIRDGRRTPDPGEGQQRCYIGVALKGGSDGAPF